MGKLTPTLLGFGKDEIIKRRPSVQQSGPHFLKGRHVPLNMRVWQTLSVAQLLVIGKEMLDAEVGGMMSLVSGQDLSAASTEAIRSYKASQLQIVL